MVAYPAIKSILSDLNQLSHTHLDKHHHHVRLLYQGSCASKSMEPLLVTQPELKNFLPRIPCSEVRRDLPAEKGNLCLGTRCHCNWCLMALQNCSGSLSCAGLNASHQLPRGDFAAEQHKNVPGRVLRSDTLPHGRNRQMQRKLNGQMNVKIIGATISDLMNMLLKLQFCLANKTKQKPQ